MPLRHSVIRQPCCFFPSLANGGHPSEPAFEARHHSRPLVLLAKRQFLITIPFASSHFLFSPLDDPLNILQSPKHLLPLHNFICPLPPSSPTHSPHLSYFLSHLQNGPPLVRTQHCAPSTCQEHGLKVTTRRPKSVSVSLQPSSLPTLHPGVNIDAGAGMSRLQSSSVLDDVC